LPSFHELNRHSLAVDALNVNLGVAAVIIWAKENLLPGLKLPLDNYAREDGDVRLCSLEGLSDGTGEGRRASRSKGEIAECAINKTNIIRFH